MRDSVADVGQLYNVTKHERFHGHRQKCGRRTGPSPKFRNDIAKHRNDIVLVQRFLGLFLCHSYISDHRTSRHGVDYKSMITSTITSNFLKAISITITIIQS